MIRNDKEHQSALEELNRLFHDRSLSDDEADFLIMRLCEEIEAYEIQYYPYITKLYVL